MGGGSVLAMDARISEDPTMPPVASVKRPPGTLAERFWSIAKSAGPAGDDSTNPEPKAVVRHVLKILDALSAGEVGDGVSQSTISFLTLLRQQEAAGDLSYASPEQARGETLDERSLVFSVGVLMFEELTGRHPFGAVNNPRRFARIQKCELGSGVQYFPQVPGQLRTVLMRAMGPFPEERFASLRELRLHLERFVYDQKETGAPQRPQRLKGLPPTPAEVMFGGVEDLMPTQVHKRLTPSTGTPALTSAQAAPQPERPPSVARSLTPAQGARTLEVPVAAPPSRARAIGERLAWLGLGVGGTLAVTFLLVPGLRSHNAAPVAVASAPVVAAPAAAPVATPVATPLAAPVATPVAAPAAAAPSVKPAPVAAATPVVASAPAAKPGIDPPAVPPVAQPGKFDINLAGKNATVAARQCFPALDHSVSFGTGLLFSHEDPVARRTFLSPDEPLSQDERKCLKTALLYASAGAAPDKNTVIEFRFKIRPGDGTKDTFTFTLPK
jgi:hypothetical protein